MPISDLGHALYAQEQIVSHVWEPQCSQGLQSELARTVPLEQCCVLLKEAWGTSFHLCALKLQWSLKHFRVASRGKEKEGGGCLLEY